MTTAPGSTVVARLSTGEAAAGRIADVLAESFDAPEAAVAAFEEAPDRWTVAIHFRNPPNETAVRALVALAADADVANALVFENVQRKIG